MRIVRTIPTPWTVYGLAFSHDGTRIAIGGGSFWGRGGIRIADLRTGRVGELQCESLPRLHSIDGELLTISSVCFSADDRYLIALAWSLRHRPGPLCVFEVSETQLRYLDSFELHGFVELTPTGLALAEDLAVLRYHDRFRGDRDRLASQQLPRGVVGDRATQHLSGHRVVIQGDRAITGRSNTPGLLSLSLADGQRTSASRSGSDDNPVVTAISMSSSQDELITGSRAGELDAWLWHDGWERRRVRPATNHEGPPPAGGTPSGLHPPNWIQGICSFPDGAAAAVSACGELTVWGPHTPITTFQLDEPGSPRALAAHPDGGWLAIGLKQRGLDPRRGYAAAVVIVEVQPRTVEPAWRTPRTVAMALAAHEQRGPAGSLDRSMLDVLADVLEEIACPHAHHVRHHDPRLLDCWLIDELRRGERRGDGAG